MTRTHSTKNLIALGLAALAAILTVVYVGAGGGHAAPTGAGLGQVFVAGRDIPVGTPGATLLSDHFVVRKQVASDAIAPGAFTSIKELSSLVTAQPVYTGEQLTLKRFALKRGNPTLAGLRGRTRAIAVAGDPHQLLSGQLRDGDHVDVVASLAYPEGSGTHYTRIVLRGLLVLRASATADTGSTNQSSTTLALTDAQAQKLFWVMQNGEWSLILRPGVRPSDTRAGNDNAATILSVR